MTPLLSAKPFAEYSPQAFYDYVKSLYREPARPEPLSEFAFRRSAKGGYVLTVRREPKWLTYPEVLALSKVHGVNYQELLTGVRKRKITLLRAKPEPSIQMKQTGPAKQAGGTNERITSSGTRSAT